jgi:hypothetical protein
MKSKTWSDHVVATGGGAERATNACLLIHFSRYALVSLKSLHSKSPLRCAVLLTSYVFADSRVLVLLAAWLKGNSSSVQHPIFGS